MFRRFGVNFAVVSILLDIILTLIALSLAAAVRPFLPTLPLLVPVSAIEIPPIIYMLVPILWVSAFLLTSVYDPRRIYKVIDELHTVTLATGLAALLFAGLLYLFFREFSRWLFVIFIALDLFFLLSWRLIARVAFKMGRMSAPVRRVLIVGAGEVGQQIGEMIEKYNWMGLRLVGYLDDDPEKQNGQLPVLGTLQDVRTVVEENQVEDVVIALPRWAYEEVNKLVWVLHELPVDVRIVPDYFSLAVYRATIDDFSGVPMINLRDPALNDVQRVVKRLFDLVVGGMLTLMALPIMIVVAIVVKLDSPGPVIFKQERVGENGRIFKMYKFRSMIVGAEKLQEVVNTTASSDPLIFYKRPDDPRITRIGRFLRRTSLDELPQLFNVLKGDMSLVGPRPELPWLLDQYKLWQRKRFAVPQGMTGWWQVNGRADKPVRLDDDLYYVQNYSLWMDIYILLKTFWVVLLGKGAY
ncbi:MAG: sugar transferase [Chloroflexi bacterium]|nr:MAG: sugar transferase [Chloroflexota bacterium]